MHSLLQSFKDLKKVYCDIHNTDIYKTNGVDSLRVYTPKCNNYVVYQYMANTSQYNKEIKQLYT